MARLAIARAFLSEYSKLDRKVQGAVDAAVSRLAKHAHPGLHLEKPSNTRDDRIRLMRIDTRWRGIVLAPAAGAAAADTYCLVALLPWDKANAYATGHPPVRPPAREKTTTGSRSPAGRSPSRIRPGS